MADAGVADRDVEAAEGRASSSSISPLDVFVRRHVGDDRRARVRRRGGSRRRATASRSSRRAARTTAQPSRARARAVAAPMPDDAPEMTATRPTRERDVTHKHIRRQRPHEHDVPEPSAALAVPHACSALAIPTALRQGTEPVKPHSSFIAVAAALVVGCGLLAAPPSRAPVFSRPARPPPSGPVPGPSGPEPHLKNIRQLTFGGENAEAYFSRRTASSSSSSRRATAPAAIRCT